jgi:PII-like signaling protein
MKSLLLMVYVDETDMDGDLPLYESIVRRLLAREVAGATVHSGLMGYGRHGQVHRKRLFGMPDDRPILITSIDEEARIRAVLPELRQMVREGLVAVAPVEVV